MERLTASGVRRLPPGARVTLSKNDYSMCIKYTVVKDGKRKKLKINGVNELCEIRDVPGWHYFWEGYNG